MSSTVIKGGTIVTADLTYKADVKIEHGVIVEIGPNLAGNEILDATGCYVMPGGIDPACASRNALHGHLFVR